VRKTFFEKFDIKIFAFEFKSIELISGDTAFSVGRRKHAAEIEANAIGQLKSTSSWMNRDPESHLRMTNPAELETNFQSSVPQNYSDKKR